MNSKLKLILLGIFTLAIVAGMLLQVKFLFQAGNMVPAAFLIIGVVSFIGFISMILKSTYQDVKNGFPSDDERSKKVKLYAAGRAYFYSLYIWIVLLAFKKYLDQDDLLLIGLLGMALSFGMNWFISNKQKGLE